MVALVVDEDLRLVLQPAEGVGMDDAVAVALEGRAERIVRLGVEAPARRGRIGGIGRAPALAALAGVRCGSSAIRPRLDD